MKHLFIVLFLLPLSVLAQKIKLNEYDKFIKQRRIESAPLTILATEKANVSLSLSALSASMFIEFSGYGWGAATVDAEHQVIFLLSNDSTVTVKSTGLQSYEISGTQNMYKHRYTIRPADLEMLSRLDVVGIRKYNFKDYADLKIPKDFASRIRKLNAIFLEELKKARVIHMLKVIDVKDVASHVGDSVMFCSKVYNSRFYETSDRKPTLLDVNSSFDQMISAVIWEEDRGKFHNAPEKMYTNKEVCISGVVQMHNNLPRIVIRSREQIRVKSPVSLEEVALFVGDSVTVQGQIYTTKYFQTESALTLLNMGAPFPDQLLTVVIKNDDRPNFMAQPENYYLNKKIGVTGKVVLYREKPQIVIHTKDQVEVLADASPAAMAERPSAPVNSSTVQFASQNMQAKMDTKKEESTKAEFPGGPNALQTYLQKNLKCPSYLKQGETKTVLARFTVNPDGSLSDFKIERSAGKYFDREVMTVLKTMPKWKPEYKNGQPVAITLTQPITFNVADNPSDVE